MWYCKEMLSLLRCSLADQSFPQTGHAEFVWCEQNQRLSVGNDFPRSCLVSCHLRWSFIARVLIGQQNTDVVSLRGYGWVDALTGDHERLHLDWNLFTKHSLIYTSWTQSWFGKGSIPMLGFFTLASPQFKLSGLYLPYRNSTVQ